jgi:Mce-associated membrane protein
VSTTLTAARDAGEGVAEPVGQPEVLGGDPREGTRPVVAGVHRAGGRAVVLGVVLVAAIGGLVGWLGYLALQGHGVAAQHAMFVQMAQQGALDLTSIDYAHVDGDVQRILDSSTGKFHDDFQSRSQPFVAVVKQAQSKSEGTVNGVGLESLSGDSARVLVAVVVKTTSAGNQSDTRAWRMRIDVQEVDGSAKMSNVEFVP